MEDKPLFLMNKIRRNSNFYMPESHTHTCYELYYLLSGTQKFFIQHTVYSMQPQDIAIIMPGVLHRTTYAHTATHERIVIMFDAKYIAPLLEQFPFGISEDFIKTPTLSIPPDMQGVVQQLFTRLFSEYEQKDIFSDAFLSCHLQELILEIARLSTSVSPASKSRQPEDEAIGKAAYFISNSYHRPLTLSAAAEVANLSPSYFSQKFKAVTGFGFKEYLTQIRLQHAARELIQTKDSITDIAFRCGFENSNYFGDLFCKANGVSPRGFRLQHEVGIPSLDSTSKFA